MDASEHEDEFGNVNTSLEANITSDSEDDDSTSDGLWINSSSSTTVLANEDANYTLSENVSKRVEDSPARESDMLTAANITANESEGMDASGNTNGIGSNDTSAEANDTWQQNVTDPSTKVIDDMEDSDTRNASSSISGNDSQVRVNSSSSGANSIQNRSGSDDASGYTLLTTTAPVIDDGNESVLENITDRGNGSRPSANSSEPVDKMHKEQSTTTQPSSVLDEQENETWLTNLTSDSDAQLDSELSTQTTSSTTFSTVTRVGTASTTAAASQPVSTEAESVTNGSNATENGTRLSSTAYVYGKLRFDMTLTGASNWTDLPESPELRRAVHTAITRTLANLTEQQVEILSLRVETSPSGNLRRLSTLSLPLAVEANFRLKVEEASAAKSKAKAAEVTQSLSSSRLSANFETLNLWQLALIGIGDFDIAIARTAITDVRMDMSEELPGIALDATTSSFTFSTTWTSTTHVTDPSTSTTTSGTETTTGISLHSTTLNSSTTASVTESTTGSPSTSSMLSFTEYNGTEDNNDSNDTAYRLETTSAIPEELAAGLVPAPVRCLAKFPAAYSVLPLCLVATAALLGAISLPASVNLLANPRRPLCSVRCLNRRLRSLRARHGEESGYTPILGKHTRHWCPPLFHWRAARRPSQKIIEKNYPPHGQGVGTLLAASHWEVSEHGQMLMMQPKSGGDNHQPTLLLTRSSWNQWKGKSESMRVRYIAPTQIAVLGKASCGELLGACENSQEDPTPSRNTDDEKVQSAIALSSWDPSANSPGKKNLHLELNLDMDPMSRRLLIFFSAAMLAAGTVAGVCRIWGAAASLGLAAFGLAVACSSPCLQAPRRATSQLSAVFGPPMLCTAALIAADLMQWCPAVTAEDIPWSVTAAVSTASALSTVPGLLFESDCLGFLLAQLADAVLGLLCLGLAAMKLSRRERLNAELLSQSTVDNPDTDLVMAPFTVSTIELIDAGHVGALLLLVVLSITRQVVAISLHPFAQPLRAPRGFERASCELPGRPPRASEEDAVDRSPQQTVERKPKLKPRREPELPEMESSALEPGDADESGSDSAEEFRLEIPDSLASWPQTHCLIPKQAESGAHLIQWRWRPRPEMGDLAQRCLRDAAKDGGRSMCDLPVVESLREAAINGSPRAASSPSQPDITSPSRGSHYADLRAALVNFGKDDEEQLGLASDGRARSRSSSRCSSSERSRSSSVTLAARAAAKIQALTNPQTPLLLAGSRHPEQSEPKRFTASPHKGSQNNDADEQLGLTKEGRAHSRSSSSGSSSERSRSSSC
eukprot:TRINITY_DN4665_c0_g1_i10.p1 TRINITY_DN4665_c0_g1~~TRINITY_DN4665_c0_g1_i10.p1  ORF type:complete len:1487 (-),score=267.82 TRINITY_DN4665_c0_g1_i10:585-4448(-)